MKINYTHLAIKDLQSLPKNLQVRIAEKMRFFANLENPLRFAERLTNYKDAQYRFRVGDYRIMFDLVGETIFIVKIDHRRDIYR